MIFITIIIQSIIVFIIINKLLLYLSTYKQTYKYFRLIENLILVRVSIFWYIYLIKNFNFVLLGTTFFSQFSASATKNLSKDGN